MINSLMNLNTNKVFYLTLENLNEMLDKAIRLGNHYEIKQSKEQIYYNKIKNEFE
jgi:hypothetical protein